MTRDDLRCRHRWCSDPPRSTGRCFRHESERRRKAAAARAAEVRRQWERERAERRAARGAPPLPNMDTILEDVRQRIAAEFAEEHQRDLDLRSYRRFTGQD